jgi:hypothetical protein
MKPVPRFYGLDGKVGVDFKGLAGSSARVTKVERGASRFFDTIASALDKEPAILCVLSPWTDIVKQLRRERREPAAAVLGRITAVVTVAGAFSLDSEGKSVGNEGAEHQAEYNVYLDPVACAMGIGFFNKANIPVYDLSWAFTGRWRLWRGLIETLTPKDVSDGVAWAAILLASGFYAFHGGNIVKEGAGVGEKAWLTADAHALLFAESLAVHLRDGKPLPYETVVAPWVEGSFDLKKTEFIVVLDDRYPAHYGRTVRVQDLGQIEALDLRLSAPISVYEASLAGHEQTVLAHLVERLGVAIDYPRWREVLAHHDLLATVDCSQGKLRDTNQGSRSVE